MCVDLNGVLDSYSGWKHADHWDPPRPGAAEFLQDLQGSGFEIVVFTTRHRVGVRRWLREHGLLPFVGAITDRKPPAHVFVDDRAVCFRGDFAATLDAVRNFAAHWEAPARTGAPGQDTSSAPARAEKRRRLSSKR